MRKDKVYEQTRFNVDVLVEAVAVFKSIAERNDINLNGEMFEVDHDDSTWAYDSFEEFVADLRKYSGHALCKFYGGNMDLSVYFRPRNASVNVKMSTRPDIEEVFNVFEKYSAESKLDPVPKAPKSPPVIFIGHGRSGAWRDLKDHLHEKHGYIVEAYETGARAGHTIRDILEDMVSKSSFALLVLTGEDSLSDGSKRARQNVIHEAGLFQGKLGFPRAILLLEEGVEEFSNVQGVQYIRFSHGNIKETYGEILATLRREFDGDG